MAGAPNIVGVSTITGVTTAYNHATNNPICLVSNPLGSERVYKINNVTISNVDTTNAGLATVKTHAGTGSWGSNPGASSFYIQENESLSVQANVANLLNTVISYEIIQ